MGGLCIQVFTGIRNHFCSSCLSATSPPMFRLEYVIIVLFLQSLFSPLLSKTFPFLRYFSSSAPSFFILCINSPSAAKLAKQNPEITAENCQMEERACLALLLAFVLLSQALCNSPSPVQGLPFLCQPRFLPIRALLCFS